MVPAESQAGINKDSVGSSTEVVQVSVVSIIANQTPFKAGGCNIVFMNGIKLPQTPLS